MSKCLLILLFALAGNTYAAGIMGATEPKCFEVPPEDFGPCEAYIPDVYYDRTLNKCIQYIWGGCGDGGRGFSTVEDCERECTILGEVVMTENMKIKSKNPFCNFPAVTGMCKAYFPSFYYDMKTGKCKEFVYGGCGGNTNRFSSLETCQKTCTR